MLHLNCLNLSASSFLYVNGTHGQWARCNTDITSLYYTLHFVSGPAWPWGGWRGGLFKRNPHILFMEIEIIHKHFISCYYWLWTCCYVTEEMFAFDDRWLTARNQTGPAQSWWFCKRYELHVHIYIHVTFKEFLIFDLNNSSRFHLFHFFLQNDLC